MRYKTRHRVRRFLASGSPLLFAGAIAITSVVVATLRPSGAAAIDITRWILLGGVLVGMVLLAVQMTFEYRKRTYEPTWAFKFDDIFNSDEMEGKRSRAAKSLKANENNLSNPDFSCPDLDDVFDFFESLGFYMDGDQITPEVVHHWYHHWIRGYYSAGRKYLNMMRKEEPALWTSVQLLFDATSEIELEEDPSRYKQFLEGESLAKFLDEEINLVDER